MATVDYTPNWSDPRTQKRLRRAIGFATSCLGVDKPRQWSSRELDRWIGYTHKPLGKYLRSKLLVVQDDYYEWGTSGAKCKTYTLNVVGVNYLINKCEYSNTNTYTNTLVPTKSIQHEWILNTYPEIASGAFEYKDKNNRLWHPLQNVRNELRTDIMASQGYAWEYDIQSAAPTLIFQLAQQWGLTSRSNTHTVEQYLKDPNGWRNRLAQDLGITTTQAKQIITARFAGATLRNNRSIHEYLEWSWHKLRLLRLHTEFQQLSKEIAKLWRKIKTREGVSRLSPRHKWQIYFEQERRVMRVVELELKRSGVKYFLEHDGWRTDKWIDAYQLGLCVRRRTGVSVKFEVVRHEWRV